MNYDHGYFSGFKATAQRVDMAMQAQCQKVTPTNFYSTKKMFLKNNVQSVQEKSMLLKRDPCEYICSLYPSYPTIYGGTSMGSPVNDEICTLIKCFNALNYINRSCTTS
jgi:hypothetical protein